jgi:hypothetical protein
MDRGLSVTTRLLHLDIGAKVQLVRFILIKARSSHSPLDLCDSQRHGRESLIDEPQTQKSTLPGSFQAHTFRRPCFNPLRHLRSPLCNYMGRNRMLITPESSPTTTESTIQQYSRTYNRFATMARERYDIAADKEVTAQQVAVLFLDGEAGWAPNTARLYRASLAYVFGKMNDAAGREAREMIYRVAEEPERLAEMREEVRAERKARERNKPRTSAQKAKKLSADDRARLFNQLDQSRSKYAHATKLWFMAGILTGLRPSEWPHALLTSDDGNQAVLIVKNAKNTNGRGHGPERTIELGMCPASDIAIITEHLKNVRKWSNEKSLEHVYNRCRKLLQLTARRLWSRRRKYPTLYTSRHIFAADAKVVHGRVAVAALMGHASIDTAFSHYGKRHNGTGGMAVMPNASDMDAVVERNPILTIDQVHSP